ncbi:MAG: DUF1874 domain-containing protein [Thermoplasmata archaeon]
MITINDDDRFNKHYLANAFSLSMLKLPSVIYVREIPKETIINMQDYITSIVGHEATANLLTKILGFEVKCNRVAVTLKKDDVVYVFQLLERLPEGQILTEDQLKNMKYKFLLVHVRDGD